MDFSSKHMQGLRNKSLRLQSRYKVSFIKKRIFDIFVVLLFLPFWLPISALVAVVIKLDSRGPVFYSSLRVGKNGHQFKFYKFRTMVVNASNLKKNLKHLNESDSGVTFKMKNDPRLTRVGSVLRKFSLDELPQLLNILKGDMSLVGPRPAIKSEVDQYCIDDCKRLYFVPGLTCIWQVSGRSNIGFEEQVTMDLEYIQNYSMFKDLKILLYTIPAVLKGTGAY